MRISRLYYSGSLKAGTDLQLDDASAHYLRTVLRLKKSAELIVFNGLGGEFHAQVVDANKKQVVLTIKQWKDRDLESPLVINFGLAISRGDRMDLAVQKAVELGVHCMTPLLTERCVVQLRGDKKQQKMLHWQKISQHATEQSGRTKVPQIKPLADFDDWVAEQQGMRIFLDPYALTNLPQLTLKQQKVTLLSGPEGGFSDRERQLANTSGFTAVKLGKRILRTETAALAAISAVQTLWGDFGNN